ncbi:MAG: MBL fold metallo-hydrolase [Desertimonas sp.]
MGAGDGDETMRVTFHGVRGSTPCDRPEIARYGGNTSCVVIEAADEADLLLDIGTGARSRGLELEAQRRAFRGVCLVSHLHWDHIQGLPFFSPLRDPDSEMVIYAPAQDGGRHPDEVLAETIRPPLFPIGLHDFNGHVEVRVAPAEMSHGGYEIRSAPVPHCGPTNGYRIERAGRSVAYVSDHQQPANPLTVADSVIDLCAGVDLLIHDAQYTPSEFRHKPDWGHCTVEYAVWLAAHVGARRLALFHHDPDRDDEQLDRLAEMARACGDSLVVDVFAAAEGLTVAV